MVVSGGHLQLLSFLFFLLIPLAWQKRWWVLAALALLLFSYSLVTGFQPPVVRAFLSVCVLAVSRIFRWNWDLSKLQLSSGLLSLALFPQWIHSLSFFLSWLASMGFLLAPLCFRYRSRKQGPSWRQTLLTTGLIQAFVTVVFGNFSWLAVLMNALFAVPLAFVLLILSLAPLAVPDSVSHFAPGVIPFVDRLWDYLLQALQSVLIWAPPPADINFKEISWLKLWIFLLSLQLVLVFIAQQRYRRSHV